MSSVDWPPGQEPRSIEPPSSIIKGIEEAQLELVRRNFALFMWQREQECKRLTAWAAYYDEHPELINKEQLDSLRQQIKDLRGKL